ncbi:unnamed protein product, partial [Gongylonema pulchrum]|uniref:SHR-BD domain-containing protein n=1 Tax=Gongylonema pulchrum TaxID=637853 RepID=A0A183ER86_9BILA
MGFLWSKDKQLGLVHDSDGVLLPALLGKNPYAPMSVFVVDTGISRLSRFQVKYLSDMTASKVNAVANSGYVRKFGEEKCYAVSLVASVVQREKLVTWVMRTVCVYIFFLMYPSSNIFNVYHSIPTMVGNSIASEIRNVIEAFCKSRTFQNCNLSIMSQFQPDILDDGLFLGDNSVLSPNYLCVKIRFDDNSQEGWDKLQPGMWIKFKAYSPKGQPDFRIKAWSQNTSPHSSPVLAVETFTGYVFEARGTYEGVLGALKSPVFGFIEIPSEKRAQMKPKAKGVSVVWVREGRANAKTRFVLHSVEKPSHDDEQEAAGGNLFRNPMNELLKHKAAAE